MTYAELQRRRNRIDEHLVGFADHSQGPVDCVLGLLSFLDCRESPGYPSSSQQQKVWEMECRWYAKALTIVEKRLGL